MDKFRELEDDREWTLPAPLISGEDGMRERAEKSSCESNCDCESDLTTPTL